MHVLYVHQNFPAQFGHVARLLAGTRGWRCTFVSETAPGAVEGIEKIQYRIAGGATNTTHFCSRTFENAVWHTHAVFEAMRARPDIRPDLIVGHSGFGSTLFLPDLYRNVPVVNFFEYYYRPHIPDSDMDFRRDLGWVVPEIKYLRSRARNAMILLDLQNCDAAYTPTAFQKSRFPDEYQSKLQTVFDGVDRSVYHGYNESLRPLPGLRGTRTICNVQVPGSTRVVTYVSRGFESMRGFDIFMRAAKRIAQEYPDVLFFVVGTDRIAYGGDEGYLGGLKSFKDWVLSREEFDLSKFRFVGRLPTAELGRLLAATDLHLYLTVPFVLSWSMMDAMSCGAVVLGSATPPVQEMIVDGENGLLANFFDPDDFAAKALRVLRDPGAFRPLGRAAEAMITERYSLEAVLPRMMSLYDSAVNHRSRMPALPERPPETVIAPGSVVDDTAPPVRIAPPGSEVVMGVTTPGPSPFRG